MSQSTITAPQPVGNRTDLRAQTPPRPPAPGLATAPGWRSRVLAQLTRMLAQLAQR